MHWLCSALWMLYRIQRHRTVLVGFSWFDETYSTALMCEVMPAHRMFYAVNSTPIPVQCAVRMRVHGCVRLLQQVLSAYLRPQSNMNRFLESRQFKIRFATLNFSKRRLSGHQLLILLLSLGECEPIEYWQNAWQQTTMTVACRHVECLKLFRISECVNCKVNSNSMTRPRRHAGNVNKRTTNSFQTSFKTWFDVDVCLIQ